MSDGDLTLVLLHGAGSSATIWDPLIEQLGGRWPVLAPNLPGHGGEAGPNRRSIEEYATWLEAYLAGHAEGPVVLAGHSMGGAIAMEAALRRRADPSARVSSGDPADAGSGRRLVGLILICTGARLRVAPEVLAGIPVDFPGTMRQMGEYAFTPGAPVELLKESQVRLDQAGAEVVHGDFSACDAFDVMARLEQIDLPTLVLCGTEDRMTPPKYSELLVQQIPGARLELIEGTGHMGPAEQPAAFALPIGEFLEELSGEDRDDLDHYRM